MSKMLNIMIDTYCVYGFDFMGYKLSKHNPYSYHHIVKKRKWWKYKSRK